MTMLDSLAPICPDAWPLDPGVVMLNHGSFGACPRAVLQRQAELRAQMEARPVQFLTRDVQPLLDASRRALAKLVGTAAENLVFVANATAGVNAVLRSLRLRPGDELLLTDQAYNACGNVLRYVAQREGAAVVMAEIPIPVESPGQIIEAVLAKVTRRTRLAMLDHVTSATAVVFPVAELARRLGERGVEVLVDGAHAPGMLPLAIERLGAAYYAGNCHKWLCAPKGAGFLYARPDRQQGLVPPVISHGQNQPRPGYTRFQDAFDWQGTDDPTPWLCVGEAIGFLNTLADKIGTGTSPPAGLPLRASSGSEPDPILAGGIERLMRRNRELATAARRMLCQRLSLAPLCAEEMLASMAAVLLPRDAVPPPPEPAASAPCPLASQLFERFAIEVPVYYWPGVPQAILRISAQAYNGAQQYARLADGLEQLLHRG